MEIKPPPESLKTLWQILKAQHPQHELDEKSFQDWADFLNEEVEVVEQGQAEKDKGDLCRHGRIRGDVVYPRCGCCGNKADEITIISNAWSSTTFAECKDCAKPVEEETKEKKDEP